MLHVNQYFCSFCFFAQTARAVYANLQGADALRVQIMQRTKDIAKVWLTGSTTQTEIWRILGYFPFWPIICLIREFMAIAAVCSIFLKKKALSQILVFHPYSMIVSCLFCSSEVWCLQKLRNQWIITGLAKVINFLGAYLGFYQIIINK